MQDSTSVIAEATKKCADKLAERREISVARMYEILGKDNPYPKSTVLIRDIAQVNPQGYVLVKADMLALFAELDGLNRDELTDAEMSQELHDPLQARLDHRPNAERVSECREAISVLAREIVELERKKVTPIRSMQNRARNGR